MAAVNDEVVLRTDDLTFSMYPGGPPLLQNVCLELKAGSRCLVVGESGSGKSLLLELFAGSKMGPSGAVRVCGGDPFRAGASNIALVQGSYHQAINPTTLVHTALALTDESGGSSRQDTLAKALRLEKLLQKEWCALSDGERRRVELFMKLKDSKKVVLLDEATTDLDVVARRSFLEFLQNDGATVVCATSVLDGMESYATQVVHLHKGRLMHMETLPLGCGTSLYESVVQWLSTSDSKSVGSLGSSPPVVPHDERQSASLVIAGLEFKYALWCPLSLCIPELSVPWGSCCLVVGLNGCGKSTLLQILAGTRLCEKGEVTVLGHKAFHDHALLDSQVALMSMEWKSQVSALKGAQAMTFQELTNSVMQDAVAAGVEMPVLASRMVRLMQALRIDAQKPIGALSGGELRSVQLALRLVRPSKLLLVDEVSSDLDVLGRQSLLSFLHGEANAGCTVLYCTHILDGISGWATHILHLRPRAGACTLVETANIAQPVPEMVRAMLSEDVDVEHVDAAQLNSAHHSDAPDDEKLPFGWSQRQMSQAGAYGDYAWRADWRPADTWAYASVSEKPPVGLPTNVHDPNLAASASQSGAQEHASRDPQNFGSRAAGMAAKSSGCPFGQDRSNTLPYEELIARGIILPHKS